MMMQAAKNATPFGLTLLRWITGRRFPRPVTDETLRSRIIVREEIARLNDLSLTRRTRELFMLGLIKSRTSIPMHWLSPSARDLADRLILTGEARICLDSENVAFLYRS